VTLEAFEQKMKSLSKEADPASKSAFSCQFCKKQYASANQYAAHIKSKKHITNASKEGVNTDSTPTPAQTQVPEIDIMAGMPVEIHSKEITRAELTQMQKLQDEDSKESKREPDVPDKELTEEEYMDLKIKNAKLLSLEDCLFCSEKSVDLKSNLDHMTQTHGFFIPDIEYLKDLEGLIKYLGEKIAVGNLCLQCNGRGKAFHSTDGVQAHMREKSHCRIDDSEEEYDEFYDFSSDWQEIPAEEGHDPNDATRTPAVRISDTGMELVFKDGRSVGHRSLHQFYRQRYKPAESRDSVLINSLMQQYRALGWTEQWHQSQASKKDEKLARMKQQHSDMKLGVKAHLLVRHFRKQIL